MTLRDLSWLILGLLIALGLGAIAQDRLSRVEAGYAAGTYLAQRPDYAALYRTSVARALHCDLVRAETPTRDLAVCQWWVDDRAGIATLVVEYDEAGNPIDDAEYPAPAATRLDLVASTHAADAAVTLAATSALGLGVEANPITSGLLGSPLGGAAWIGAKLGLSAYADTLPFAECISWRSGLGRVGVGQLAAIVGGLAGPVGYLAGAAVGYGLSAQVSMGDAVARCLQPR